MRRTNARFATTASALAAAVLAGCAGGSTALTPWRSPAAVFPASYARPGIAEAPLSRMLAGTWNETSSCPSSGAHAKPTAPDTTTGTLFVSEFSSSKGPIEEYDASGSNQNPLGAITSYVNHAWGESVDQNGTLYVANFDQNNVLEFPQGQSVPSVTLNDQILFPIDTGTDQQGNLYVVNGYGGPIMVFPPGSSTPSSTISGFFYPTQIAFDSAWNMYVVDELYGTKPPLGAVLKFAPGAKTGSNLGLTSLDYPVGLAVDAAGDIAVSNLGNNSVQIFATGKKTPKRTITQGVCSPVFMAYNAQSELFVANEGTPPSGVVVGYKPTVRTPSVTLTKSMSDPRGLAVNPNWQP